MRIWIRHLVFTSHLKIITNVEIRNDNNYVVACDADMIITGR